MAVSQNPSESLWNRIKNLEADPCSTADNMARWLASFWSLPIAQNAWGYAGALLLSCDDKSLMRILQLEKNVDFVKDTLRLRADGPMSSSTWLNIALDFCEGNMSVLNLNNAEWERNIKQLKDLLKGFSEEAANIASLVDASKEIQEAMIKYRQA